MSASKRVNYPKSDQEAPLFCKVKAERSGLFSRPPFHFLWILSAYEVSRSAKLMGTPIQSCTTQWCPPLKSHIKSEPWATCFAIVLYESVLKPSAKCGRALNNETKVVRVTTMASSLYLPFCGATSSDQSSDLPFGEQSLYHPCWLL